MGHWACSLSEALASIGPPLGILLHESPGLLPPARVPDPPPMVLRTVQTPWPRLVSEAFSLGLIGFYSENRDFEGLRASGRGHLATCRAGFEAFSLLGQPPGLYRAPYGGWKREIGYLGPLIGDFYSENQVVGGSGTCWGPSSGPIRASGQGFRGLRRGFEGSEGPRSVI